MRPAPERERPHQPLRPLDVLSELGLDQEMWSADPGDPRWDDPDGLELRALDVDPDLGEQGDVVEERLTTGDTRWSLDLADPYAWVDPISWLDLAGA